MGQENLILDLPSNHGVQSVIFSGQYLITIGKQGNSLCIWRYRSESHQADTMAINIEDVSMDHHANPLTIEEDINVRLEREL
jgi:hypothetical protein